jgi:hypothetical protein
VKASRYVIEKSHEDPLKSTRVNEIGNKVEPRVIKALEQQGFRSEKPSAVHGGAQASGYPDILFFDKKGRPTYIECKTHNKKNSSDTFRSFYLSPSRNFKVSMDARHILIGFEIEKIGARDGLELYRANHARIISFYDLTCGLKLEFQNSNKGIYREDQFLAKI